MNEVIVVTSMECDPIVYGPYATYAAAQDALVHVRAKFADDENEGDDWNFQIVTLIAPK